MQIHLQSRKFSLTDSLQNYAKRRLNFSLANKSEHIRKVTMRLSDINGPRGGADKCCHLQIQLNGIPDVVVEDTQTDMYTSIDRACDRAGRTVVRKISRQQTLLRQTPPLTLVNESLDEEVVV